MEITQGVRFDTLGLSPEIMRALEKKGYALSTPIQAGCIPPMLDWQDVTAKAPTGTGKTFAFGIPIIEHVDTDSDQVQAVILAPTRELAMQITAEMRELAQFKPGIRLVCLYGGQPIGKQIDALKKRPQIVIATPGRLGDHLKRRTVRIDQAQTAVLDEADRMLDMGFIHDVTKLLDQMKNRKNLGLFSATISREVMDIAWVYQRDAVEITVQADEENKPDILQYRLELTMNEKVDAVERILNLEQFDRVMIFCNTKGNTERVTKLLQMRGVDAQCIHGDIPQEKREKVMARFRRGELRVSASYDAPTGQVTALLSKLAGEHPLVLADPEPAVHVEEYGDSAIRYVMRVWCANADYWTVYYDLLDGFKPAFDEAGVEMTYPHVNVHMVER